MKGENIQRVISGTEQQVPPVCFSAAILARLLLCDRECASNYVRQVFTRMSVCVIRRKLGKRGRHEATARRFLSKNVKTVSLLLLI